MQTKVKPFCKSQTNEFGQQQREQRGVWQHFRETFAGDRCKSTEEMSI